LARHTPSQRPSWDRDETEKLMRDLQSLINVGSEEDKLSPAEGRSEAITLRSGTLERIDNQLRNGEIREAYVSIAIEREI
jgi:hypothetical protein